LKATFEEKKNMKKLITAIIIILCGCAVAKAQDTTKSAPHAMLMPDANTVYLDENQHKIDGKEFSEKIATGHYTFKPELDGGKVKSMGLVKVEGALQLGAPAPDFSVMSIDGKTYKLTDLQGKTVVLNFWFTACMPCREEMPGLNELVKTYKSDPNVVFIAITFDEADKVKAFLKEHDFSYPVAAGQRDLIKLYGIAGYPTNVVIDKSGHVCFMLATYSPDNVSKLGSVLQTVSKM
jgi:peroxiredoxin